MQNRKYKKVQLKGEGARKSIRRLYMGGADACHSWPQFQYAGEEIFHHAQIIRIKQY